MVFESTDRWPSVEGDERLVPPPLSSYGFQKLAVEYFARAAWDQYELPYTILRPFNCVGIGERRALGDVEVRSGNVELAMSHVVPDLVQKVLKGQDPLHILGDGNQVRHYTYGGDLARGHRRRPWSTRPPSTRTSTSPPPRPPPCSSWPSSSGRRSRADEPLRYVSRRPVRARRAAPGAGSRQGARRPRLRGHDHPGRDARRGHPLDRASRRPRRDLSVVARWSGVLAVPGAFPLPVTVAPPVAVALFAAGSRMGGEGGPFGALGAVAGLVGAAVLLLAPGLAIASFLSRRGQALHGALATTVVVGGSAGARFAAFFAWYASPAVGRTWSLLVIAGSALVLAGRAAEATRLFRPLAAPLALMLVVVITATGFAFDRGGLDAGATTVTERYWVGDDNLLPEILADKLYEGGREPGAAPLLRLALEATVRRCRRAGSCSSPRSLAIRVVGYQSASALLQGLWVLGLWALLAALQVEPSFSRRWPSPSISVSGFALVDTVFVWPKLLAGAFALLALAVLIERPPSRPRRCRRDQPARQPSDSCRTRAPCTPRSVWCRCCRRHRREVMTARWLGTGVSATGGAVMVPWFAYQRFADPPGDALLKWPLAGVIDVEERFQLLRRSAAPPMATCHDRRRPRQQGRQPAAVPRCFGPDGLGRLVLHARLERQVHRAPPGRPASSPCCQRSDSWPIFGLVVTAARFMAAGRSATSSPRSSGGRSMQFGDVGPAGAFLHHGPYATFLLVFAIAVTGLATRLPRTALRLLLAAHLAVFIGVWSVGLGRQSASAPPHDNPGVAGWSLATGVIGLGLLAVLMWWLADPQQRRPRGITQGALGA